MSPDTQLVSRGGRLIIAGHGHQVAARPELRRLRGLLRSLREGAGLTQRDLGARLGKPQSWVHNCETGNRRVDVSEFAAWASACGREPADAFRDYLDLERRANAAGPTQGPG